MNCKSCDNGLTDEEEKKEQCRPCQVKEFVEPMTDALIKVFSTWQLNGESTRELIDQFVERASY